MIGNIQKKVTHMRRVISFHEETCTCDFCCYITSVGTEENHSDELKEIAQQLNLDSI